MAAVPRAIKRKVEAMWTKAPRSSSAEIGRRLGITKNAVVGIAHRLGLPSRPSPIKRDPDAAPKLSAPRRRPPIVLPPLSSEQAVAIAVLHAMPVPIDEAPARGRRSAPPVHQAEGCRFPLWPHSARAPVPPTFCGKPRIGTTSYCAECAERCFSPAGKRLWGTAA